MTHSVGRQSGAPFVSGPGATNNVTNNFTGGPWTFIRTNVDSSAEVLATWRLDEDTGAKAEFVNDSSTNGVNVPALKFTTSGTNQGGVIDGRITTDSGSQPGLLFRAGTAANAALSTRPLFGWLNYGTSVGTVSAKGTWNFVKPAEASVSEVLATWTLSDNATAKISFENLTAGDTDAVMGLRMIGPGNNTCGYNIFQGTTDSATNALAISRFQIGTNTAVATRPLWWWQNNTSTLAALSNGGVFSLGSNSTAWYSRLGQKLETNTSAAYGGIAQNTWSTTAAEANLTDWNRSKSATIGTQAVVASGDALGYLTGRGSDGASFQPAAAIQMHVDGTPGTNDMPGRITLWTTPDGSVTLTERARITNAGDVGIGKTPTTGIILDLGGQLGLKSYTVATLPSASVQAGAIVYASDAGGNGPCIVVSNGTNWKRCDNTSTTVS